jgi:hypothetical protein
MEEGNVSPTITLKCLALWHLEEPMFLEGRFCRRSACYKLVSFVLALGLSVYSETCIVLGLFAARGRRSFPNEGGEYAQHEPLDYPLHTAPGCSVNTAYNFITPRPTSLHPNTTSPRAFGSAGEVHSSLAVVLAISLHRISTLCESALL